jgi:hypothetical protein
MRRDHRYGRSITVALVCTLVVAIITFVSSNGVNGQSIRVQMDAQPSIPAATSNIGKSASATAKKEEEDSGMRAARATAPSAPSGVTVKAVPSFTLTDRSIHFTNEVADRDLPVIIRGTKVDEWQAAAWTPSTLAQRLNSIRGVKRTSDVNSTFHYCYDSPMDLVEGVGPVYRQHCWQQMYVASSLPSFGCLMLHADDVYMFTKNSDMSAVDFVSKLDGRQDDGRTYAYSTTTDQWDETIEAEISPVETVMVIPSDYAPEKSHTYRQTVGWVNERHRSSTAFIYLI